MSRDEIPKKLDWHASSVERRPQSLLARIEKLVAIAEATEREARAVAAAAAALAGKEYTGVSAAIRARGKT